MVQILQRAEDPTERIGRLLGGMADTTADVISKNQGNKKQAAERAQLEQQYGMKLSSNPDIMKLQIAAAEKERQKQLGFDKRMKLWGYGDQDMDSNDQGKSPLQGNGYTPNLNMDMEALDEPSKAETKQLRLPYTKKQIALAAAEDPAQARIMNDQNIAAERSFHKDRELEFKEKESQKKSSEALRKETLPLRTEIANKARAAKAGIENKLDLLKMIDTGKLDDPSFAATMEALPFNYGLRFLSPETIAYKSGLVDEYKDLRNIFQGQTRVKELEILEEKIADIYLTDDQKKRVLKTRINALSADIVRGQVAAEMEAEGKDLGILQFTDELEKRVKDKLKHNLDEFLDSQNAIFKDAENRKNRPLSLDDPEDVQIIDQFLEEAGGDADLAFKNAQKKGYKFQ